MSDPVTEEKTVEVDSFFGKKRVNREDFVRRWVDHASQLENIGMFTVVDEAREKAGITFDKFWDQENPHE